MAAVARPLADYSFLSDGNESDGAAMAVELEPELAELVHSQEQGLQSNFDKMFDTRLFNTDAQQHPPFGQHQHSSAWRPAPPFDSSSQHGGAMVMGNASSGGGGGGDCGRRFGDDASQRSNQMGEAANLDGARKDILISFHMREKKRLEDEVADLRDDTDRRVAAATTSKENAEEHARAVTHDLEATQFELQSCRVSIDEKEEDLRSSALHIRKLTHEKALVLGELNGTKLANDALQTQLDEERKRFAATSVHQLDDQRDAAAKRGNEAIRRIQTELDTVVEKAAVDHTAAVATIAALQEKLTLRDGPQRLTAELGCQTEQPDEVDEPSASDAVDPQLAALLSFDTVLVSGSSPASGAAEDVAVLEEEVAELRREIMQLGTDRDTELTALRDEMFRLRDTAVGDAVARVAHEREVEVHQLTQQMKLAEDETLRTKQAYLVLNDGKDRAAASLAAALSTVERLTQATVAMASKRYAEMWTQTVVGAESGSEAVTASATLGTQTESAERALPVDAESHGAATAAGVDAGVQTAEQRSSLVLSERSEAEARPVSVDSSTQVVPLKRPRRSDFSSQTSTLPLSTPVLEMSEHGEVQARAARPAVSTDATQVTPATTPRRIHVDAPAGGGSHTAPPEWVGESDVAAAAAAAAFTGPAHASDVGDELTLRQHAYDSSWVHTDDMMALPPHVATKHAEAPILPLPLASTSTQTSVVTVSTPTPAVADAMAQTETPLSADAAVQCEVRQPPVADGAVQMAVTSGSVGVQTPQAELLDAPTQTAPAEVVVAMDAMAQTEAPPCNDAAVQAATPTVLVDNAAQTLPSQPELDAAELAAMTTRFAAEKEALARIYADSEGATVAALTEQFGTERLRFYEEKEQLQRSHADTVSTLIGAVEQYIAEAETDRVGSVNQLVQRVQHKTADTVVAHYIEHGMLTPAATPSPLAAVRVPATGNRHLPTPMRQFGPPLSARKGTRLSIIGHTPSPTPSPLATP